MRKKTKKQPYKNALLKLTKERSSLDSLYKENQRLNANLLYKQKEAQTLLRSAAVDKEKMEQYRDSLQKELRDVNPYHPNLYPNDLTFNVSKEDALRYRISSPSMSWDDNNNQGIIRMVCYNQTGKYETVAYAFSGALIKDRNEYINEELVEDLGKTIARDLLRLTTTKMKEW